MQGSFQIKKNNSKIDFLSITIFVFAFVSFMGKLSLMSDSRFYEIASSFITMMVYITIFFILLKKKMPSIQVICFILLSCLFLVGYFFCGMSALFQMCVWIFAMYKRDYKDIFKIIFGASIIVFIIGVILGLITLNLSVAITNGFYLGFGHKNQLGFYIAYLFILYNCFTRKTDCPKFIESFIYSLFILFFTQSRTATISVLAFYLLVKIFDKRMKKVHFNGKLLAVLLVPFLIAFTYITAINFTTSGFVQLLNRFFNNRIFLNWYAFDNNKISLLGQNIQMHNHIDYNEIIQQGNINTTIDGTYTIILLVMGLIPTILYILIYIFLILKEYRNQNNVILAATITLAIYAFMETGFTNILLNFPLFYLTAYDPCVEKGVIQYEQ